MNPLHTVAMRKHRRRWRLVDAGDGWWRWEAIWLFEFVGGYCPSENDACKAIDHFLDAEHTYTL